MKKIFINTNIVYLSSFSQVKSFTQELNKLQKSAIVFHFTTKKKLLEKLVTIEDSMNEEVVLFIYEKEDVLEKAFFSLYSPIVAAGGAVFNEQGKLLMIFRKNKWDLPKGKMDKGESVRKTALREIREETGIGNLKIVAPVKFLGGKQDCTYHTYLLKGKRVMKSTYWFKMSSTDTKKLIPQEEEGIQKVEWCSRKQVDVHLHNSFHSIEEVVGEALK